MVKAVLLAFMISVIPTFSTSASPLQQEDLYTQVEIETEGKISENVTINGNPESFDTSSDAAEIHGKYSTESIPHDTSEVLETGDLDSVIQETEWETEWSTEKLEIEESEWKGKNSEKTQTEEKQDEKSESVLETEKGKSLAEKSRERFNQSDLLIQIGTGILLFVVPYGIILNKKRKR